MSTYCVRHDLAEVFPDGCPACNTQLERARVVAVLDGWADKEAHRSHETVRLAFGAFEARLHPNYANGHVLLVGPTPDAARAAAAKAIEAGEV